MTTETFAGPIPKYPVGMIIPWHNPLSEIPSGWVICDGNNGTVDLMNRFPKSIPDGSTDPGTTGGNNSYSLAEGQLPSHSHSPDGATDTTGSHNHEVPTNDSTPSGTYSGSVNNDGSASRTSTDNGGHSHSGLTDTVGAGNSIDNQPAYEETAFIKRIH